MLLFQSRSLIRQRVADRNDDCCVNAVDEKNTMATNLLNFGPVTMEILWLISMGGKSTWAKILCALVCKFYSLGGSSIPVCR